MIKLTCLASAQPVSGLHICPSPIRPRAKCDNGVRSPLAPTVPFSGTHDRHDSVPRMQIYSKHSVCIFGPPLKPSFGYTRFCLSSVVCLLSVMHVLWLNGTFYNKNVWINKEGCPTSTLWSQNGSSWTPLFFSNGGTDGTPKLALWIVAKPL